MRLTTTAGASLALLLAITACGGGGADPQPEATVTVTAEPDNGDAHDDGEDDTAEAVEGVQEDEDLAPKDMDFSDDPLLSDREFTGRMTGDVTTTLGEPTEIDEGSFEGIGDYMGDLTLTELVAAYECETYTEVVTPVHGDFLVATFTMEADEDADGEWSIYEGDFRWEGFDDEIATYDAWMCQDANSGLTDAVRPGETVERTYVFDIPEYEGTLTYRGATNYVSWEIERADYANAERLPENAGDPVP